MEQLFKSAAFTLLVICFFACGVPKDEHQSALDEIKKLKADMAAQEKSCTEAKDECEKRKQELSDENTVMKAKLIAAGQDLSKLKTKEGAYLQDLSQKEQQIAELLKAQEAARKRAAMFKGLLSKFKEMIDSGKLQVEIRKGRMIVKMSDKILFDTGKDKIKKEGMEALKQVTTILASIPDRHFQVAGHTDNVPIKWGRFKSNWELSAARAVNVVKFMSENGMDAKRLSASGYSEYDPVGDNQTEKGRALNRRIEITLMPNIEELPKIGE